MHTTRGPSSIPTGVSGDALDLSLSGSQLSVSKRPSSASPGKCFSRSVSVSRQKHPPQHRPAAAQIPAEARPDRRSPYICAS